MTTASSSNPHYFHLSILRPFDRLKAPQARNTAGLVHSNPQSTIHNPQSSRRFATAAFLAALLAPPAALAQPSITVVSWGGSYARSSVKAYHERFTAETGIEIKLEEYNGGLAQVRAQVETGNISWDVVDVEAGDNLLGCDEGLFEEIDRAAIPPGADGTPATEDFFGGLDVPCGIPNVTASGIYAYNDARVGDRKPTAIADFFDLETFPGRRGMRRGPTVNLEFALLADGVPAEDVYDALSTPAGVDRAFAKLDTIKSEVLWWETGAQPPQMLADGEVVMSTAYNGRIFNAWALEGQPLKIVWDGQILGIGYQTVVKGTPRAALARRFAAYATSTRSLANVTRYISYGPARRSAMPLVDTYEATGIDIRPHLPNAPQNVENVVYDNPAWWADHKDELNERFAAWLVK